MKTSVGRSPVATLFDSAVVVAEDRVVRGGRVWSTVGVASGAAVVVPDLSIDVVWHQGEMPVVTERSIDPFVVPVALGDSHAGIRFSPVVTDVEIDRSWPGWRSGARTPRLRRELLVAAVAASAVRPKSDVRVGEVVAALDRPRIRIGDVADGLGISQRQLHRWTLARLGLAPKEVHRRLRMLRFGFLAGVPSLAQRSLLAGFYDQAHAANEIRVLAGVTASALAALETADSSKTAWGQSG